MAATMTNAALSSLIQDAGKKLRAIRGTTFTILLNQPYGKKPTTNDDIELVSQGGIDMIKVKTYNPQLNNYYYRYYITDDVKLVVIAENATDFIDPGYFQV